MPSKINILIPDGESHLLMPAVNCLSQFKNAAIYILSSSKNNMRFSKNVAKFIYYKPENDLDFIHKINTCINTYKITLVVPIFEHRIKTILQHKDLLDPKKLCLLPSLKSYDTAICKATLAKHLTTNNINTPKTEVGWLKNHTPATFPLLIKPITDAGGGYGIYVFNSPQEFNAFAGQAPKNIQYLFQEYIDGYDIDCSVLCKNGKVLAYTIQKGFLKGVHEFAPQIGIQFVKNKKLLRVVKETMKTLNWSGLAHLDMRYDIKKDTYSVIEINPRFWASIEGSLMAGINFAKLLCLASIGYSFKKPTYKKIPYINLKGLIKKLRTYHKSPFSFSFIWHNTPFKFYVLDPIPTLYKYFWRTKNILLQKIK